MHAAQPATKRSCQPQARQWHELVPAAASACRDNPLRLVVGGGDLLRSHRQARRGGRCARVKRLAQQNRHRVTGVIGERAVKGDVGQRSVAVLPGDKGGMSLAAGDGARAARFCNPRIRKHRLRDSPAFTKVTLDPAAALSSAAAMARAREAVSPARLSAVLIAVATSSVNSTIRVSVVATR
jgi:hypothetical protein